MLQGLRVLCLLPPEMLLNKGAAAPGLSWGGDREGEAECESLGASLDVPSTGQSLGTLVDREGT